MHKNIIRAGRNLNTVPEHPHTHAILNNFGFFPHCSICMFSRLTNYPCGEKDKGQSKVSVIILNGLSSPTCFHVFLCAHDPTSVFSLCFIISGLMTDGALALKRGKRDSLLEEKHSERQCYYSHVGLVGKRLTSGHRLIVNESLG